jgi:hypothetical protein
MWSKVKILLYFAMLIPFHAHAVHSYQNKSIPLAYPNAYESKNLISQVAQYFSLDVLNCTQSYFPKKLNKETTELSLPIGVFEKSKHLDKQARPAYFDLFAFDDSEALADWYYDSRPLQHSNPLGRQTPLGYQAPHHMNSAYQLQQHDLDVLNECYINVANYNPVQFAQFQSPISPVPEMPKAILLLAGLGLLAFIYRSKMPS